MLRLKTILGLILIISINTKLQAQQEDSLKALYPLHVGDFWEYKVDDTALIYKAWIYIKGDTILENGKRYFTSIYRDDFGVFTTSFLRISDSLEVIAYFTGELGSGEQLVFRLDAKKGDTWVSSDSLSLSTVTFDSTYEEELFGQARARQTNLYKFRKFNKKTGEFIQETFQTLTLGIGWSHSRGGEGIVLSARWTLKGAIIDGVQYGNLTSVNQITAGTYPTEFELLQNYPNPFNAETMIKYHVRAGGQVNLSIFNLRGQKIRALVDELRTPGEYETRWDGRDEYGQAVASGIYVIQIQAGEMIESRKITLLK
jgi:hypothetical protein